MYKLQNMYVKYNGLKRKIICDQNILNMQTTTYCSATNAISLSIYNNTVILHVLRIPYDWKTNYRKSMDCFVLSE